MSFEDPAAGNGVVTHVDESRLKNDISNYRDVLADAQKADEVEHTISLKDAFRVHKKAIMWSMLLSSALIMEGYDVVVVRLSHLCISLNPYNRLSFRAFFSSPFICSVRLPPSTVNPPSSRDSDRPTPKVVRISSLQNGNRLSETAPALVVSSACSSTDGLPRGSVLKLR